MGIVARALMGPFSSMASPSTFMMRPRVSSPTGTAMGCTGVDDVEAAGEAFGRTHRDGAHHAVAELLLDFEGQPAVRHAECVVHLRHAVALELDVDDGPDDRDNAAIAHLLTFLCCSFAA